MEWLSVDVMMPTEHPETKKSKTVIVVIGDGEKDMVGVARTENGKWVHPILDKYPNTKVTHWMPYVAPDYKS